ncbi:MAG: hypothetical protein ABIR38_00605 [Chthoniobacterales bacterium]
MLAVTFALANESRDFNRLLGNQQRKIAILHTGVGKKTCQERIAPFLDGRRFEFAISSGFAGGVDPSLGVGDLLLADNYSDPALLARAHASLAAVPDFVEPGNAPRVIRVARLVTAARIIESAAERAAFAREHNAAAVDMETEWIAQACADRKIPLLSLRAISDTTAAPFPAPPSVLFNVARQRTNPVTLAAYLLTHPGSILRLARFAHQIANARENLAVALTTLLPFLD